jgi:hypothetical protein
MKRIAKPCMEDEALRIDQNRLTNVLDEFFNDLKFYEQTVAWILEDQVSPEDVADEMERE